MSRNDGITASDLGAHPFELPDPGFDPISAGPSDLLKYGVPERPDASAEPELYRFWKLMFSPPIEFIRPEFRPEDTPSGLFYFVHGTKRRRRLGARARVRRFAGRLEDSRNWSGAYITPLRPNRFVYVAGRFKVPDARLPCALPSGANRAGQEYRSSTWVGIGGHRSYNSLPQIGVAQRLCVSADGLQETKAGVWWQWWVKDREKHGFPIEILHFPVHPGHKILASLTVQASGDVHFCLKNEDTSKFVTFLVNAPENILPLGTTAEWIHERPMIVGRRELYPLPSTTGAEFNHDFCLAKSAPQPGAPETMQKLDNPRFIRMYEAFDNPHRAAFVSIPSIVETKGERYLRVRYRDAGE